MPPQPTSTQCFQIWKGQRGPPCQVQLTEYQPCSPVELGKRISLSPSNPMLSHPELTVHSKKLSVHLSDVPCRAGRDDREMPGAGTKPWWGCAGPAADSGRLSYRSGTRGLRGSLKVSKGPPEIPLIWDSAETDHCLCMIPVPGRESVDPAQVRGLLLVPSALTGVGASPRV